MRKPDAENYSRSLSPFMPHSSTHSCPHSYSPPYSCSPFFQTHSYYHSIPCSCPHFHLFCFLSRINFLYCYRVIIEWVESNPERLAKSPRLDHFTQADMNTTRFEQLSLRLGYPYLYCHHGNCEHGIVFTDLRLVRQQLKKPICLFDWFVVDQLQTVLSFWCARKEMLSTFSSVLESL